MDYKITGYEPAKLFHYFEEISAIPRESGNEKQISDCLLYTSPPRLPMEFFPSAVPNWKKSIGDFQRGIGSLLPVVGNPPSA